MAAAWMADAWLEVNRISATVDMIEYEASGKRKGTQINRARLCCQKKEMKTQFSLKRSDKTKQDDSRDRVSGKQRRQHLDTRTCTGARSRAHTHPLYGRLVGRASELVSSARVEGIETGTRSFP